MIRAIKAVSTERGRDPREFALFAFGGNGPLFACRDGGGARHTRIVVPPSAGLFSSFGLLYADVEHHYARTFRRLLRQADLAEIERGLGRAGASRRSEQLAAEGFTGARARLQPLRGAALQGPELRARLCRCPTVRSTRAWSRISRKRSAQSTRSTYGHRAGAEEPVELVAIQVVGQGVREAAACRERVASSRAEPAPRRRAAPISARSGLVDTPVMRRSELKARAAR